MNLHERKPSKASLFEPAWIGDWLKLMRVHQWSKNVLLFVPLIIGQTFTRTSDVIAVLIGFIAFSFAASGSYIVNDIVDIKVDRAHATKHLRPIAFGTINAGRAFIVAMVLIIAGLTLMTAQSARAGGLLSVYLITSISYSSALKRMAMVDIFVLGSLYTIRVVIGSFFVASEISYWLIMFSFFFFFSLSLAKRHVEIVKASKAIKEDVKIEGRGYRVSDAPLTLSMGVASNLLSILILSLYVTNDMYPRGAYNHPQFLWAVVIVVMMWSSRVWLLSHRGELHDGPVLFALKDPPSILMGLVTAAVLFFSVI